MAQAFRAGSKQAFGASVTTSQAVSEGTGWAQNDFLLALVCGVGSGMTLGLPTGWTSIASGTQAGIAWNLGWIIRGASAPSLTFTTGTGSSIFLEIQILAFTGINTSSPIQSSAFGSGGTANTHSPAPPALAGAGTNVLMVVGGGSEEGPATVGGVTTWFAPAGYTINSDNNRVGIIASATSDALSTGAQTPDPFTGAATHDSDYWDGFSIALAAAGGGGGSPTLTQLERGSRGINRGVNRGVA